MNAGERKRLWLGLGFISPWLIGFLALTLGTSRLRTHPGDARARGGVAILDAAIAFLGVKPRASEIALADR